MDCFFPGFPSDTFHFLAELERNNNREWFTARSSEVERILVAPAQAFVAAFGERVRSIYPGLVYDTRTNGAGSLFRMNRDTRFSKDKSPYKTNLGLRFWLSQDERVGKRVRLYVHLDRHGVKVYGGEHCHLDQARLHALRAALVTGAARPVQAMIDELLRNGFSEDGEKLGRIPRGYPVDHPNADLLRRKSLFVSSPLIPCEVALTPVVMDRCVAYATAVRPLNDWLGMTLGNR